MQRSSSDSYQIVASNLRQVSLSKYLKLILDVTIPLKYDFSVYGSVSFRIKKCVIPILGYFNRRYDTHLMVLDCDSTDQMLIAARTLKIKNVGYALVQSSSNPPHYWIITDYVGSFFEVLHMCKSIPGVDSSWIRFSEEMGLFCLRGMALPNKVPVFQNGDGLKNPIAIDVFNEFRDLYEYPEVKQRLDAEILKNHVAMGTVSSLIQDPDFEL